MSKNSKFTFDVDAFIGGTLTMKNETLGCYLRLWILQCKEDHFTIDQARDTLNGSFEEQWPKLEKKFKEENGNYYNARLRKELEKSHPKPNIKLDPERLNFPFISEKFNLKWQEWLNYRKEIKKPYKNIKKPQAELDKLAKYPENVAIAMIDQAIEEHWHSIYPLKKQLGPGLFAHSGTNHQRTDITPKDFSK